MPVTKLEFDFKRVSVKVGGRAWQIDNDLLPSPIADGEWESIFAEALVDLSHDRAAEALTCYCAGDSSLDFGHHGYSVWITLVGDASLVKAAEEILKQTIPEEFIRPTLASAEMSWMPRIRIENGMVWRPHDGAEWIAIPIDEPHQTRTEDVSDGADKPRDSADTASPASNRKRRKAMNAARDDVNVGHYQQKIERLLCLPTGSVKLINPDRSISHPGQLIGSLRERWAED